MAFIGFCTIGTEELSFYGTKNDPLIIKIPIKETKKFDFQSIKENVILLVG